MPKLDDGVMHFSTQEPVLLSEALHNELNVNFEQFKSLIKLGAVYVNNDRQVKDRWILESSTFRVHTKPRRFNCNFDWKSLVVFQNDSFLILNKPSGIPSHPSVDNVFEDSLTQTSMAIKIPLFVTHRLDTLTSGLIVYAKKRPFVKDFNIQLVNRAVTKNYVALVETEQTFPKILNHYMDPSKGTPKKISSKEIEGWDLCKLEILEQKKIAPNRKWIKINLLTGRTHQIRAQMSFLNAPIVGDKIYGAQQVFRAGAIALKSCEIEFLFDNQKIKFSLDHDLE